MRATVLAGDLPAAARLLSEAEGEALSPLAAEAAAWSALQEERRALASASRELLRESVEARIAEGDLSGAAAHLAAALQAWPEDPAFLTLAQALGAAAEQAPPATAALAWQALAELLAHQPEQAAAWRERAVGAELAIAYGAELEGTLAARRGVRRAAAVHLLHKLDAEYVDAPDWAAASRGGRARLLLLARTEGARARWPRLADVDVPSPAGTGTAGEGTVADAVAALDAAVAALEAAGVPAEVAVSEWVAGALAALDPWTRAVWPAEIAAWQAHHAGVQVDLGLELDLEGEQVVVVAPALDGPGWRAGVHQGDALSWVEEAGGARLALDALPVDRRLEVARQALVGAPDSVVRLGLVRAGQPLEREAARAAVPLVTVEGWRRAEDNAWDPWLDEAAGLAYARVSAFREHTEPAFDALLEPVADRARAVVLDLRGNAGGDVNAAVRVADRFVVQGRLAGIHGRVLPDTGPDVDPATGERLAEWNEALAGHALEGLPVVVLVDPATASAAEVVAGALQELAGAVVVGSPTFGKGRAQALRAEREQGYAVQFTNLSWTLPGGRRLERGSGVVPQVALPAPSPGEDFRTAWQRAERTAVRAHPDGSPMRPVGTPAREDLPPLQGDPAVAAARLVAQALLLEEGG
ncbi:S41 family peptidase [Myxococcota bacterium]|nr:S41 family peptidase [Myxococcota bacterium]